MPEAVIRPAPLAVRTFQLPPAAIVNLERRRIVGRLLIVA